MSWHKHSQKWYAYIQAGGRMRGLGYFATQLAAALAHDAEARRVRCAIRLHTPSVPCPALLALFSCSAAAQHITISAALCTVLLGLFAPF